MRLRSARFLSRLFAQVKFCLIECETELADLAMWVRRIKLESYSSFADSGWIELARGLNVVVGENNAGKSALLAAIGGQLQNKPHRNIDRFRPGEVRKSRVQIDIETTTDELRRRLAAHDGGASTWINHANRSNLDLLQAQLQPGRGITLETEVCGGTAITSRGPTFPEIANSETGRIIGLKLQEGKLTFSNKGTGKTDNIVEIFRPAFFNFSPQRVNIAKSGFGHETKLSTDARNLPVVLAELQGSRPNIFDEIETQVREIVPSVARIRVTPAPHNGFEILVWSDRTTTEREHAFSLEDCGTGVAQAIAIMTAVTTSDDSVIVVDEVNSFLHPGAVKRLLQICTSEYAEHQYVVSTHSAEVISFPGVERLIAVERSGFESSAKVIDRDDMDALRVAVRSVGIGMIDVLGFDRVVWVEGPTEESVFPMMIRAAGNERPAELSFAAVASTGDFSRRGSSRKAVIDLYDSITRSVAPLTQGWSFALDRETLSESAVHAIEQKTDGRLLLLPRRCIECYAICPSAIASVITAELGPSAGVSADLVEGAISNLAPLKQYGGISFWNGDLENLEWLIRVDGAALLRDVFRRVTDDALAFRKTQHTPKLIAEVPPARLAELADYVERVVAVAMQ